MANRPRRPRPVNPTSANAAKDPAAGPSTAQSGGAQPPADEPDATNAAEAAAPEARAPDVPGGGNEAGAGDTVPAREAADLDSDKVADTPSERSALPPPAEQPSASERKPADIARQQAEGENPRAAGRDEAKADASETEGGSTAAEGTTAAFAAEEGLHPERRDLGEFEDDETISASEPHRVPESAMTGAYAAPTLASERAPAGSSGGHGAGALVGAGLAGAVLALLGAAALGAAGLSPFAAGGGNGGEAAYASGAQMETLSSDVGDLRTQVEQLQSAQAAGGAGTSYAAQSDVSAVSDRLASLESTVQTLRQNEQDQATQASETAQQAQSTAEDARGLAQQTQEQLTQFEDRFTALEEQSRQANVALAAAGLKAAIDRGGAFMPELETFASATGGGDDVEALRQYASEGVPTQRALLERWPDVERDLRQALTAPGPDANIGDRVVSGLSSLVTVRPAGTEAPSNDQDGAQATLSRMTAALNDADYAGWHSAWEALPAPAQDTSQAFADDVAARMEADRVVNDALNRAATANPNQG